VEASARSWRILHHHAWWRQVQDPGESFTVHGGGQCKILPFFERRLGPRRPIGWPLAAVYRLPLSYLTTLLFRSSLSCSPDPPGCRPQQSLDSPPARIRLGGGRPPPGILVGRCERRQLLDPFVEPAHATVLRKLLGPRCPLEFRRSHQDCSLGWWRRYQPFDSVHFELRDGGGGKLPRVSSSCIFLGR